jgi:hypothetical protein
MSPFDAPLDASFDAPFDALLYAPFYTLYDAPFDASFDTQFDAPFIALFDPLFYALFDTPFDTQFVCFLMHTLRTFLKSVQNYASFDSWVTQNYLKQSDPEKSLDPIGHPV